jgi:hypothetical protein
MEPELVECKRKGQFEMEENLFLLLAAGCYLAYLHNNHNNSPYFQSNQWLDSSMVDIYLAVYSKFSLLSRGKLNGVLPLDEMQQVYSDEDNHACLPGFSLYLCIWSLEVRRKS